MMVMVVYLMGNICSPSDIKGEHMFALWGVIRSPDVFYPHSSFLVKSCVYYILYSLFHVLSLCSMYIKP